MELKKQKKAGVKTTPNVNLPKLFMEKPTMFRASLREERSIRPNPNCDVCRHYQQENDLIHANFWRVKKYCRNIENRLTRRSHTMDRGVQAGEPSTPRGKMEEKHLKQDKLKLWSKGIWDDDIGMASERSHGVDDDRNIALETYLKREIRRLRSTVADRDRRIGDLDREIAGWKSRYGRDKMWLRF